MGWSIACLGKREECGGGWASNIRELIEEHRDGNGWFRCECGGRGYISKAYDLQEGDTWNPILVGAIRFNENPAFDETYFPFIFLVAYCETEAETSDIWFSYYKDTRPDGRLKMGHGPGGPPVVSKEELRDLVARLQSLDVLDDG